MRVKFRIIFEDNTILESHDKMWNEVKDHCHALLPHSKKKWKEYHLIVDDNGPHVSVNFQTGLFNINGQLIHPADKDGTPLTNKTEPQNFPVTKNWGILNGLPYFPIVGRRQVKGDWGGATLYFVGWKRKRGERTIEKVIYLFPNNQVVMT